MLDKIFGELLMNLSVLSLMPDEKRISEYLVEAFKVIPGIGSVSVLIYDPYVCSGFPCNVCKFNKQITRHNCIYSHDENYYVYKLDTVKYSFGFIVFKLSDKELFKNSLLALSSVLVFISIQMENVRYRNERESLNVELKKAIDRLTKAQQLAKVGCFEYYVKSNKIQLTEEAFHILDLDKKQEATPENVLSKIEKNDVIKLQALMAKSLTDKKNFQVEFSIIPANGVNKTAVLKSEIITGADGNVEVLTGTIQDISDRKRDEEDKLVMQAKLIRSERLASLGTLAAGVGHEINNPIFFAMGFLDELKAKDLALITNKELNEILNKIEISHMRIQNIVKSISTFTRYNSNNLEMIDIHKAIWESLLLVQDVYAVEGIDFKINFNAEKFLIQGNSGNLQQIFLNLFSNSKDALLEKNAEIKTISITTKSNDKNVNIIIADNGPGLSTSQYGIVFDYFYTTKPPGKGTGLGLSVVNSLVTKMNGVVFLEPTQGGGLTCVIEFPFLEQDQ